MQAEPSCTSSRPSWIVTQHQIQLISLDHRYPFQSHITVFSLAFPASSGWKDKTPLRLVGHSMHSTILHYDASLAIQDCTVMRNPPKCCLCCL